MFSCIVHLGHTKNPEELLNQNKIYMYETYNLLTIISTQSLPLNICKAYLVVQLEPLILHSEDMYIHAECIRPLLSPVIYPLVLIHRTWKSLLYAVVYLSLNSV
jgi:hypothetical protein